MTTTEDDSTDRHRAVQFTYEDVAYTVDLDEAGAQAFDEALAPFISAGRRVGGTRPV